MNIIYYLLFPAWIVTGWLMCLPIKSAAVLVSTILGLAMYCLIWADLTVFYNASDTLIGIVGVILAIIGHSALFGWLCSPAGQALTLTPIDRTISRLMSRTQRQYNCELQLWSRTATVVFATALVIDILGVVLLMIRRTNMS